MELAILILTAGSAVVEIKCGSIYRLEEVYTIFLNGEERGTTQKVVTSLFNLSPDRDYLLQLAGEDGSIRGEISFHTKPETAVLNVRDFGASGEGEQDDTVFIQAAIMACPPEGRVVIPPGKYRVTSLFLKATAIWNWRRGPSLYMTDGPDVFRSFPGFFPERGE